MAVTKRCRESFAASLETGGHMVITAGTLVSSDDPIFKRHQELFEDVDHLTATPLADRGPKPYDASVEQATAAPGEKRSVGTPKLDEKPAPKAADSKAADSK